jgi:hypothetical protein
MLVVTELDEFRDISEPNMAPVEFGTACTPKVLMDDVDNPSHLLSHTSGV